MPELLAERIQSNYAERFPTSAELYRRARERFPSGVTHDGRFLTPFPVYIDRASGSRKVDVDGNELVDYWNGHGALLLGHSHPAIVEAVQKQVARGTHFGACHRLEIEWADWISRLVPSAECVRFTSSGTEATLMALRVAKIASGKRKVIKFAGHFHGWHDYLIPAAYPPHDDPAYESPGISSAVRDDLVVVPPNDLSTVAQAIDEHDPACVIVEATGGRWGVVPMRGEFLRGLRKLTEEKGVILVMDEVVSGFRVHPGGVQGELGIQSDLTTFAKVLAGGLPGGCLAGRNDLMQVIAFDNSLGQKMPHHGTFNANPLSAAAGSAALELVSTGEPCQKANVTGATLRGALNDVFAQVGLDWVAYGDHSMVKIFPGYDGSPPASPDFIPYDGDFSRLDRKLDTGLMHALRCAMLLGGVDLMGWGGFTTAAHSDSDVAQTAQAMERAIDLLRTDGLVN